MGSFLSGVQNFLDEHSDPRTEDWLLVSIWSPIIILSLYFTMICIIIPYYVKSRNYEPLEMTAFLHYYNAFILFYNLYITLNFMYYEVIAKISPICQAVDLVNEELRVKFAEGFWLYLTSKTLELADSAIIILRGKTSQQGFLQAYHHSTMFLWAWMGCRFLPGGSSVTLATLNSFFHFIIYLYFHLCTYSWSKGKTDSFRNVSIISQVVQFSLGIAHCITAIITNCGYPRLPLVIMIFYIFSFFSYFYLRHYLTQLLNGSKDQESRTRMRSMSSTASSQGSIGSPSTAQSTFLPAPAALSVTTTSEKRSRDNRKMSKGKMYRIPSVPMTEEEQLLDKALTRFRHFLKAPRRRIDDPLERFVDTVHSIQEERRSELNKKYL